MWSGPSVAPVSDTPGGDGETAGELGVRTHFLNARGSDYPSHYPTAHDAPAHRLRRRCPPVWPREGPSPAWASDRPGGGPGWGWGRLGSPRVPRRPPRPPRPAPNCRAVPFASVGTRLSFKSPPRNGSCGEETGNGSRTLAGISSVSCHKKLQKVTKNRKREKNFQQFFVCNSYWLGQVYLFLTTIFLSFVLLGWNKAAGWLDPPRKSSSQETVP